MTGLFTYELILFAKDQSVISVPVEILQFS